MKIFNELLPARSTVGEGRARDSRRVTPDILQSVRRVYRCASSSSGPSTLASDVVVSYVLPRAFESSCAAKRVLPTRRFARRLMRLCGRRSTLVFAVSLISTGRLILGKQRALRSFCSHSVCSGNFLVAVRASVPFAERMASPRRKACGGNFPENRDPEMRTPRKCLEIQSCRISGDVRSCRVKLQHRGRCDETMAETLLLKRK